MIDFVFQHPTKVIFGRRGLEKLGEQCALFSRRVLLVYGRHSLRKSGGYQRVCASLKAAKISWIELDGIVGNPVLAAVRQGVELVRKHKLTAVVAVGGGSVIDSAKAIAAGACVAHDVWLFFRGKKSIKGTLPLICVPTLAGSGSEYNNGMVLTHEESRQKIGIGNRHLFPATAILDPELTCSAPWRQTLYGAVDSICHLSEIFVTDFTSRHRLQDRLATGLIRSIMESCERVRADPADYPGRAALLWASTLALSGLNGAGRGRVQMPAHLVAHALGGRHNLPHGATLAALLSAWLGFEAERRPARVAALNAAVFNLAEGQAATVGLSDWQRWLRKMGAPTSLAELGPSFEQQELEELTAHAALQSRLWRHPCTAAEINCLLSRAA